MKIPTLRIAQTFFFLNALFVALWTGWSVDHGVLSDPEFAMLLVFNWPSTLFALVSVLATALIAIISAFFTRDNKFILLSLSLVLLAYYIFLGSQFDLVSNFTLVAVSFLYAAFIGINVVLSYADVNKKLQMVFMVTFLLSALLGILLWDEQQQRFRLQFENSRESKALLRAAYKGDTRLVQQLLSEGADIDALDALGWDALHNAVRGGHVEAALILLENGANPDTRENKEGGTFCIDPECHRKDLVKGNPVIVSAAKIGNVRLAKILIEHGADLYATNTHCESVLTVAIRKNNHDLLKLLLDTGFDLNHKYKRCNENPLVVAVRHGKVEIVKKLQSYGADTNAKFRNGKSLLQMAALAHDVELVDELLRHGANPNTQDNWGITPLMSTVKISKLQVSQQEKQVNRVVEMLLAAGADVNAKDGPGQNPYGETALMKAAKIGLTKTVSILLEAGAKVNIQNSSGRTALIFAAMDGDKQIVQLLLQAGADKKIRDIEYKTALDWAISNKHPEVLSLLRN